PEPPEPESDAPSIAGSDHTLAPDADGTLWTWGHNEYGQLGNGTTVASTTPVSVTDVAERGVRITGVAAGTNHSVALDEHGTIWTWGKNEYGQLGTGTNVDSTTPVSVTDLPSPDTPMTHVAAGPFRTFALDRDGHLWAWGYGPNGSVGTGTPGTYIFTPVSLTDGTWPGPGVSITDVAAGGSFSLALDATGTVWAWGANKGGQLGTGGAYGESLAKVSVTDLAAAGARITRIAAGHEHALALDADGTVWTWGTGYRGQLGNGETAIRTTPVSLTDWPGGPVRITDVAAGRVHSLALDVQGRLWAWGYNDDGQLGDGTTVQRTTPVRVSVTDASGAGVSITDLAAGTYHSLARDRDGHLWTWGRNDKGQRGDGTTAPSSVPRRVPLP
ncbi:MAG: hypothetical protein RI554_08720, partial [Trueperaceae bacterium]|nr:hypothetical protein [Trueperaceae bacterium]